MRGTPQYENSLLAFVSDDGLQVSRELEALPACTLVQLWVDTVRRTLERCKSRPWASCALKRAALEDRHRPASVSTWLTPRISWRAQETTLILASGRKGQH
eukprot:9503997-Pyramimonas_sp.AAC.4